MVEINLLPSELKPKGPVLKLSKTLKKLVIGGFAIFLFVAVLLTGAFLIVSNKLKASLLHQEELKSEIAAYQQTEQNLLLTKDRLAKIGLIYGTDTAREEVIILDEILGKLPGQAIFKEVNLLPDGAEITVLIRSSVDLTLFLRELKEGVYKKIELTSFIFKNGEGYEVKLSFAR